MKPSWCVLGSVPAEVGPKPDFRAYKNDLLETDLDFSLSRERQTWASLRIEAAASRPAPALAAYGYLHW